MSKKTKTTLGIFYESLGLYFSNFDKFIRYMSFPIWGQIFGFAIICLTTYLFSTNISKLINKYPEFSSFGTLLTIALLITLPGLIIFCKAVWEYLVAYGSVNSMLENMLKSGRVYDFDAHTELIKRRSTSFIGLWIILGIFSIIAVCPLFWVICGIFAIYFVLVFQVFTYEPELSPVGCIKKSLILIKGHFLPTFILVVLIGLLTYLVLPQIFTSAFDGLGINAALSKLLIPIINLMPEFDFAKFGIEQISAAAIAAFIIKTFISQIIIQYTLPLRSILWALWYKELNNGLPSLTYPTKTSSSKKKKKSKRPSEKLMEESHKRFSKKKLDDDIIRRATEKDEDE